MCDYKALGENINNWIRINQQIDQYNSKIKLVKEHRDKLEKNILNSLKQNSLTNKKFKIDNSHVFYNQSTSLPSFSITLLEKVLDRLVNSKTKQVILDEIKKERESNKTVNISLKKKKIRKGSVRKSLK
tara:strand:+ start:55 stop:441 length:387 start_codon:yes stop_codon:yes gene_type:complete